MAAILVRNEPSAQNVLLWPCAGGVLMLHGLARGRPVVSALAVPPTISAAPRRRPRADLNRSHQAA
jgi:hypothetical protein